MTPDQVRAIIKEELEGLIKSDRYTFQKNIQMMPGRHFQFGTDNGTMFGTSALQKMGFWGVTPVVQHAAVSDLPTGGSGIAAGGFNSLAERDTAIASVNSLLEACRQAGIIDT